MSEAVGLGGVHGAVRTPWRWGLVALGGVCVGLGFVGAFVPGLPTTVFLIVASWCFVRSCPELERRVREHRVLGRYMRYVGGEVEMPRRAKAAALGMMWFFVATSVVIVCVLGGVGAWFGFVVGGLGLVGTVVIWRYGRGGVAAG